MTSTPKKRSKNSKRPDDRNFAFRFYGSIVVPIMCALSKITVEGAENLPKTGPIVITPNHFSNIDPLVIAYAVYKQRRAPRFLAKSSLFKIPVVGAVLRQTGQIRVERHGSPQKSNPLSEARQIIEQESVVIVYPEGTLTRDPKLWPMRGKTGAVRLATVADLPILPVAHWGTQHLMPRYGKLRIFPRSKITVKFGEPYRLPNLEESGDLPVSKKKEQAVLYKNTDFVMDKITEILAELRNETPPEVRWDPTIHGQKETGKF